MPRSIAKGHRVSDSWAGAPPHLLTCSSTRNSSDLNYATRRQLAELVMWPVLSFTDERAHFRMLQLLKARDSGGAPPGSRDAIDLLDSIAPREGSGRKTSAPTRPRIINSNFNWPPASAAAARCPSAPRAGLRGPVTRGATVHLVAPTFRTRGRRFNTCALCVCVRALVCLCWLPVWLVARVTAGGREAQLGQLGPGEVPSNPLKMMRSERASDQASARVSCKIDHRWAPSSYVSPFIGT